MDRIFRCASTSSNGGDGWVVTVGERLRRFLVRRRQQAAQAVDDRPVGVAGELEGEVGVLGKLSQNR